MLELLLIVLQLQHASIGFFAESIPMTELEGRPRPLTCVATLPGRLDVWAEGTVLVQLRDDLQLLLLRDALLDVCLVALHER